MEPIRVLVNGALGKMGSETVKAVNDDLELLLVGQIDSEDDLAENIRNTQAQVVVDFTHPSCVYSNLKTIIAEGAHPVIGTTGLSAEQIDELQTSCKDKKLGGLIAPNFALGAVMMMKLARQAAKVFPHVEIIELHHDRKADAPSGTAVKTAELIASERGKAPEKKVNEKETFTGARGGRVQDIQVHSVRLPGLVAHQEVIFGGKSETLRIRHDSLHRESFMPGVCLACKQVVKLKELVYGLDNLL